MRLLIAFWEAFANWLLRKRARTHMMEVTLVERCRRAIIKREKIETIRKRWISWAGNPNTVQCQCDRGLHNRGVLAQSTTPPLEIPEAIGRVERHGGVLKGMARKVISQTQGRGEVEIQSVLDESCLTKNE